jgi:hypothetical protein
MDKLLKTGKGWRLGWNPEATKYKGLVGADDWAFELTEAELLDFCRLLVELDQTMKQMGEYLMEGEKITCDSESDLLWLSAEGFPHSYSLRLLVHHERCVEGNWDSSVVNELVKAVQSLMVF